MNHNRHAVPLNTTGTFRAAGLLLVTLLLTACGGGGGDFSGDRSTSAPTPAVISGVNSFLLFPNPQLQADGSMQMNSAAYPQAYYAAIDPTGLRTTLNGWKAVNGFGSGTGTELTVVFGDVRDLGYGRRMTARMNVDGTVAVMVENYLVEPAAGYTYNPFNLAAAVVRDPRWHIGTNAIEFSPGPAGGVPFAKFYTFNPVTGARETEANLDGRGGKAMPGPCISCHGGRGDPLTPPGPGGQPLFPLVMNAVSATRGDVQARLQPLEVDALDFSATPGYTRAEQEATIKAINQMVLCTYPIPAAGGFPEDACRRIATVNEWQGAAGAQIKNAYGGDGLPNAAFADTTPPNSFLVGGQTTLYRDVLAPACRACHILRGTGNQSDIDFETLAKVQGYGDRIKAHVIDRGNMPLARLIADKFFTTGMANIMATFLETLGFTVRDGGGAVLMPGRPVADPGPARVVRQGATTLSAAGSQFSTGYQWSIVSGPGGATLTSPTSVQPTLTTIADGSYVLQLATSSGAVQSTPVQLTVVVDNTLTPVPAAIRFADIKAVLQGGAGCTNSGCHSAAGAVQAPIFFTNMDRNGDAVVGDATDDLWFYTELRGRINFTDIVASPLLRKPSGNNHKGLLVTGFDTTAAPGQVARVSYDLFLNWILNGASQ